MPEDTIEVIGGQPFKFPTVEAAKAAKEKFEQTVLAKYPSEVHQLAKGLVNYKLNLPGGLALSRPGSPWNAAAQAAQELDPDWNAMEYPSRQRTLTDFKAGKPASAITSFNTVIGHLGSLAQAAKDLHNTGYPLINTIKNEAQARLVGNPALARFNISKTAVADEMETAFRITGGTETGVKNWRDALKSAATPAEFENVTQEALRLLGSRIYSLREQYKKGMGMGKDMPFLYPDNRNVLRNIGYDPDKLDPVAYGKLKPSEVVRLGADDVTVVSPDGVQGTVPRANLQKAIERGYKEVKP